MLFLSTRISLVIHARELKRTTNTGRLLMHALPNSVMLVRGQPHTVFNVQELLRPDFTPALLYPAEDAIEISDFKSERPVNLIVPDGNWRQAGKVHLRHPELANVPRVRISDVNVGREHLRREHLNYGYSTLEAAALALRSLEGENVYQELKKLYMTKLSATMAGRPRLIPQSEG